MFKVFKIIIHFDQYESNTIFYATSSIEVAQCAASSIAADDMIYSVSEPKEIPGLFYQGREGIIQL